MESQTTTTAPRKKAANRDQKFVDTERSEGITESCSSERKQ